MGALAGFPCKKGAQKGPKIGGFQSSKSMKKEVYFCRKNREKLPYTPKVLIIIGIYAIIEVPVHWGFVPANP